MFVVIKVKILCDISLNNFLQYDIIFMIKVRLHILINHKGDKVMKEIAVLEDSKEFLKK